LGSKKLRRVTKRRFAAKLLFQFRVMVNGHANRRRVCEERMIVIAAQSAEKAYQFALKAGRSAQYHYKNHAGNPVHFEFVGILDLLQLGIECGPNEVWYDIKYMLMPKERSKRILPPKRKLNAIYWATSNNRWRGP
jgi:Domain of unknown function (DUF4288)